MKRDKLPQKDEWRKLCVRPGPDLDQTRSVAEKIMREVKKRGDDALREYTTRFDRASLTDFIVGKDEIYAAEQFISEELKTALLLAKQNIGDFHAAELDSPNFGTKKSGQSCWREFRAIERVGLYAPGGSFPLLSTVLMLAEPARIAGCRERILCTPPNSNGSVNPGILYAAKLCEVTNVFKLGGAHALAAMAYGTESVPAVDKIFGPGNRYVTAAKLALLSQGYACDLPAGPSEALIIADSLAKPEFIAAELLAQAEHGADSQVVLLSESSQLLDRVEDCLLTQAKKLCLEKILQAANDSCLLLKVEDLEQAFAFSNQYAPEHLLLALTEAEKWVPLVQNAGAVFLGEYSSVVAGDYASGPNHTLPTAGFARAYSGVSLVSFMKSLSFQQISRQGLKSLAPSIISLARAEGMLAHAAAIDIRMENLL